MNMKFEFYSREFLPIKNFQKYLQRNLSLLQQTSLAADIQSKSLLHIDLLLIKIFIAISDEFFTFNCFFGCIWVLRVSSPNLSGKTSSYIIQHDQFALGEFLLEILWIQLNLSIFWICTLLWILEFPSFF
jgi:hypothetical protein